MAGEESEQGTQPLRRGIGDSMYTREAYATREAPWRANKGAPGVDRQDFTEVEAYGVERWLGELAQALKGSRKGSSTSSGTRSDGSIHRSGRPYLGAKPSRKSVKHVVEKIHALTARTGTGQGRKPQRWWRAYTTMRLRRWLCKKHKVRRNGLLVYPHEYLYQTLGLVCLPKSKRNVPW
ncbi:MAG: hypothetical protein LJE91_11010, partial [Gammaproteobacteria bacterium]|nr:hypothetical protein [Gammaproteobacteria bacterium]